MAAPSAWYIYNSFLLEKSNGVQDLGADVFSVALLKVSYTPDLINDALWTGISANEVSIVNGYTGSIISILSLALTTDNLNISMENVEWTATGGDIVAHYAVILNDTTGGLVAYCQLDTAPASVTALNTKVLTVDLATNTVYDESIV